MSGKEHAECCGRACRARTDSVRQMFWRESQWQVVGSIRARGGQRACRGGAVTGGMEELRQWHAEGQEEKARDAPGTGERIAADGLLRMGVDSHEDSWHPRGLTAGDTASHPPGRTEIRLQSLGELGNGA